MQRWEYRTVTRKREGSLRNVSDWDVDIDAVLAELGEKGWELVAVSPRASWLGQYHAGATSEELWVFKRPVP